MINNYGRWYLDKNTNVILLFDFDSYMDGLVF